MNPTCTAELVTDERTFAELADEWGALYRRCASATPFQSHAVYKRQVLVRVGGRLVAAAPLMRVGRPVPSLVPLGGAISDYGDVLLDDEHGEQAVAALAEGLRAAARTAVIDLREVRPGGAAERIDVYKRPSNGPGPSCAGSPRWASSGVS